MSIWDSWVVRGNIYRVLHSGLIVVGVGLGSHPEVEGPECRLAEDAVVSSLVPLEGISKFLRLNTEDFLCGFLEL